MKKIAILTLTPTINYGGILQAYALQKVLKKLGHEVITINRKNKTRSKLRSTFSTLKNQLTSNIKGSNRLYLSQKQLQFVSRHSTAFIKKNINLTKPIDTNYKIETHFKNNYYDTVIVGSDQTWRPHYSPNIYDFYLDFLKNDTTRRLAYASSFGVGNWEYSSEETDKCKKLLSKFDAISVRETSGIDLCKNHLDMDAELVLDPTLLLDRNEYIDLFKSLDLPDNKNKLYTYILDRTEDKKNIVNTISKKLELVEFKNQPKKSFLNSKSKNIEDYAYPPVEGWLKAFHDSEFIITDSFHGTVFSIIFNKQFISIPNIERGVDRFTSILKHFDLEHRMVFYPNEITDNLLNDTIDYNVVNPKLENLKTHSFNFLKRNI